MNAALIVIPLVMVLDYVSMLGTVRPGYRVQCGLDLRGDSVSRQAAAAVLKETRGDDLVTRLIGNAFGRLARQHTQHLPYADQFFIRRSRTSYPFGYGVRTTQTECFRDIVNVAWT